MSDAYDPLDYENLAKSVVGALLGNPLEPLPPSEGFSGVGVYAIYYGGDFEPYAPIAGADSEIPIYVGKAVPAGTRKGAADASSDKITALYRRLGEHAKSIDHVQNLNLSDFRCRYLVVVPVWITLAERFLVNHFRPLWNVTIDGFGNHPPGRGRAGMRRPVWDILHPGRPWAEGLAPEIGVEDVIARVRDALQER